MGITGFIILTAGFVWAGPQINPGQWQITTKTQMPGMPPQSMTHHQCITEEDLVPMSQDADQNCQVKDLRTVGSTVYWNMTCGGQGGQMDGTGEVTYDGDTMSGKMEMVI